jgi:hypothetical protein
VQQQSIRLSGAMQPRGPRGRRAPDSATNTQFLPSKAEQSVSDVTSAARRATVRAELLVLLTETSRGQEQTACAHSPCSCVLLPCARATRPRAHGLSVQSWSVGMCARAPRRSDFRNERLPVTQSRNVPPAVCSATRNTAAPRFRAMEVSGTPQDPARPRCTRQRAGRSSCGRQPVGSDDLARSHD